MGVPRNHPFSSDFPWTKPSSYWGYPHFRKPPCGERIWNEWISHCQFHLALDDCQILSISVLQAPVESKSIGLVGGVMLLINNLAGGAVPGYGKDVPGVSWKLRRLIVASMIFWWSPHVAYISRWQIFFHSNIKSTRVNVVAYIVSLFFCSWNLHHCIYTIDINWLNVIN